MKMEYKDFNKWLGARIGAIINGTPLPEKPENYDELMEQLNIERLKESLAQKARNERLGIYRIETAGMTIVGKE